MADGIGECGRSPCLARGSSIPLDDPACTRRRGDARLAAPDAGAQTTGSNPLRRSAGDMGRRDRGSVRLLRRNRSGWVARAVAMDRAVRDRRLRRLPRPDAPMCGSDARPCARGASTPLRTRQPALSWRDGDRDDRSPAPGPDSGCALFGDRCRAPCGARAYRLASPRPGYARFHTGWYRRIAVRGLVRIPERCCVSRTLIEHRSPPGRTPVVLRASTAQHPGYERVRAVGRRCGRGRPDPYAIRLRFARV